MKKLLYAIPLMLTIGCWHDNEPLRVAPNDPDILYMGRILWVDSAAPTFSYPGTTAAFNFRGTRLDMEAKEGSGQFVVFIDHQQPFKVDFADTISRITLADSLEPGEHSARVVYAIEGYEKHPEIHGFTLYGKDAGMLPAPERPKLKIEFIGNSITCGYGAEANDPNIGFSYDTENHTLSYAYQTARNLNADVNVVARSGIGIYRYYGGQREGTDMTMPAEYDHTLLYDSLHMWDHNSFHPDIICINLGTNDTSPDLTDTVASEPGYNIYKFEKAYEAFLKHLRQLHPDAKIVLLTGSMMADPILEEVKMTLDRLARTDKNIYRFDMTPQTGALGYGADYHPSAQQHRQMADELTTFLTTII